MKILAVDREPRATQLLEQHCRAILARRLDHFEAVASLDHATDALGRSKFDVVLLDLEVESARWLAGYSAQSESAFQTIAVAADPGLAARAFDCGVLDFVPKPPSRERLARALLRVIAREPDRGPSEQFIAVRRTGRIELVAVDDLLYVEGADKYCELVLANGQRSFHDKCLGRLEARLPRAFVRIHKSYLVRFPMVSRLLVLRGSRYFAELKNGQRLPVGRTRYEHIKSRLL